MSHHPATPYGTPVHSTSRFASSDNGEDVSEGHHNTLEDTLVSRVESHSDPGTSPAGLQGLSVPNTLQATLTNHNALGNVSEKSPRTKKAARKRRTPRTRLVLENSGSVARDHLASERTFLAYVRTSLAIASAGVALVQLFTIADLTSRSRDVPLSDANREVQRFARPLGVTMILFALIVLGIGLFRYFLVQHSLPKQQFPPARLSVIFTSVILGSLTVIIFAALLAGRVQS